MPTLSDVSKFCARHEKTLLLLLFLSALLIRLPWLHRDFSISADLPIFREWAQALSEAGLVSFYDTMGIRAYPPLSTYLFAAAGWLAAKVSASPENSEMVLNALLKLPTLLADLGTAALLVWLLAGRTATWRILTAFFYLFNPAVWYVSTYWGQNDSLYVFFIVAALAFLARGATIPAWVAYALSLGVKLQGIAILPLLLAWSFRQHGWRGVVKGGIAGGLTTLGLALPWLVTGRLSQLISATVNLSTRVVQSAYNGWYLLLNERLGTVSTTQMLPYLPLSYGLMSQLLFAATALLVMGFILLRPHRPSLPLVAALLILAAFTLLTDMRERYLFAVFPVLLLAAAGWPENAPRPALLSLYLILTITWFFNLVTIATFAPAWWHNLVAWQPPYPAHIAFLKRAAVFVAAFHTFTFIWLAQYLVRRERVAPGLEKADTMAIR